jgi:hypothetical protein
MRYSSLGRASCEATTSFSALFSTQPVDVDETGHANSLRKQSESHRLYSISARQQLDVTYSYCVIEMDGRR